MSFDIDAELANLEAGLSGHLDDLVGQQSNTHSSSTPGKAFSAVVAEQEKDDEDVTKSWFEERAPILLNGQAIGEQGPSVIGATEEDRVRLGNGVSSPVPASQTHLQVDPLPPPPAPQSPLGQKAAEASPVPVALTSASLKEAEQSSNSVVALRGGLQVPYRPADASRDAKSQGSTTVSSVEAMKKAVDDRIRRVRKKLAEPCSCGDTKVDMTEEERPMKRGEVEFTGMGSHRAHYIIVHKDQEAADEVLRWMFTTPGGWKLKPPNLILFGYGGRDHYVNWSSSETLRNRRAWGYDDGRRTSKDQTVCATVSSTSKAKKKPSEPTKTEEQVPFVQHTQSTATASQPKMTEARFHAKFRGRLGEIAGGVCQAVLECGGWFDFGHGMRGGMGEVLKDGLKVYWTAFGALAGHKDEGVVLAIRELEDTEFWEDFEACAVSTTPIDAMGQLEPLKKRVMYPSVDVVLFPETTENTGDAATDDFDDDDFEEMVPADHESSTKKSKKRDEGSAVSSVKLAKEVKHKVTSRFLLNCLTHIVFVQNLQVKDRLRFMLKDLATRAVIVANASPTLIQPGVEGKILAEAIAGVPVIILHNTGGAAEQLGNAVNKRRQHVDELGRQTEDSEYSLPENIPDDHILILNPARDSVEKVINKLTLVLSTVTDKEMMEVGYQKGERSRLRYAWELFTLFRYNAAIQRRRARILFYIMMVIGVLVTLVALMYILGKDGSVSDNRVGVMHDVEWDNGIVDSLGKSTGFLKALLLTLPVVNGFLMTLISRFNPIGKWAHLESGAVNLQSEIYQYRCRVTAYMPRKGANMSIEEKVESICSGSPGVHDPDGTEAARKSLNRKKKKKANPGPELSRRGQFAVEVERINSETIGSELRGDSLVKPSVNSLNETLATLYDSKAATTQHQSSSRSCCEKLRCASPESDEEDMLGDEDVGERMAEDNRKEWKKAFSDFRVNPYIIDDDFLRDDGFSLITAEDYIHFRLLPLIQQYNATALYLSRQTHAVQGIAFFLTALLTASAAIGLERITPLIVSLIAAVTSIDELEHFSARLRNVNQSLESLKNLHVWWQSLSMVERRLLANKEILVGGAEATVDAEVSTWKKSAVKVGKGSSSGGDEDDAEDEEKT